MESRICEVHSCKRAGKTDVEIWSLGKAVNAKRQRYEEMLKGDGAFC